MRLLRISLAILILHVAGAIAALVAGPELHERRARVSLRPAERMLLRSLVGTTICVFWIWITWRAGR
jgi:hypothetical protein